MLRRELQIAAQMAVLQAIIARITHRISILIEHLSGGVLPTLRKDYQDGLPACK